MPDSEVSVLRAHIQTAFRASLHLRGESYGVDRFRGGHLCQNKRFSKRSRTLDV
jgi:hypothetical protein